MLPVSLDCLFLIAHSVFSNVYLHGSALRTVYLITCHVFRCMLWCPLRCSVSPCSYLMLWLYFCWYLRILMSNTIIVIRWFSCLTVIRRVSLVEQKLLTLPEQTEFNPGLCGVSVVQSYAMCVVFVDHCLSFCPLSVGHCIVSRSSIYGFWTPLRYLQTFLAVFNTTGVTIGAGTSYVFWVGTGRWFLR